MPAEHLPSLTNYHDSFLSCEHVSSINSRQFIFFLLRAYCNFFPIIINEWLRMVVKQPNFQFPLYHCATIAQALAGPADDFII